MKKNNFDYISIDVMGTVMSVPQKSPNQGRFSFQLENRRGRDISTFTVIVQAPELIDILEGDLIMISKGGFFFRKNVNYIVVSESTGSYISVIRERNNEEIVVTEGYI